MIISLNNTCGNTGYFDVLNTSTILNNVDAVIRDKFISVHFAISYKIITKFGGY
jgi:hypothetical protein